MYRAAKNKNGVITEIGQDEGQSGLNANGDTWCSWTFEEIPSFRPIDGLSEDAHAMRFEENLARDGIALRSDADVLAMPRGQ